MLSTKVILCVIVGVGLLASTATALCKACSSNHALCLNETAFRVCFEGIPSVAVYECPTDQICSNEQGICRPRGAASVSCGVCGICQNKFACISQTQYQLCSAAGTLLNIKGTCPDGEYCSLINLIVSGNVCVKKCGNEPTCYAAEEEFPTTAPPTYKDSCTTANPPGFYENKVDKTCKTYVYCETIGQDLTVLLYTCKDGTYFSKTEKRCVTTKPSTCT